MLGIGIPYYKNSSECEVAFKKLMKILYPQLTKDTFLFIYEDGQVSDWLYGYVDRTLIYSDSENKGISSTRNNILDYLIRVEKSDYILFLDSDDMIDCDFIKRMYEAAMTGKYDMIISPFYMNGVETNYITRSNVAGITLRTEFIKDLWFNEEYIISEDTLFINSVYERNPRIGNIQSKYHYNYGINPNSLMMKYSRSEIGIKKEDTKNE